MIKGVEGRSRRRFPTEMLLNCRGHEFFCASHCFFE
jgi:hypothetical protein